MKALRLIVLLAFFGACQNEGEYQLDIPENVEPFLIPEDNKLSQAKVDLGRSLFYEKGLSLDSSVSCGSCHIQQFAFADTARVSRGFQGDTGFRNSSSLTNVAFQTAFFRDGGVFSLERAVHPPVLGEFEMNMNLMDMLDRLNANPSYPQAFKNAFNSEIDNKGIVQALASFQRTLLSFNSPYDKFMAGDSLALKGSQKRGLQLFRSDRLNCAKCHAEPLFIDNKMHNIGLYESYREYGRGRVTLKEEDFGKFRTPTLRNIEVSFPYMHDGSIKTLEEVLEFYKTGGFHHPNKSVEMRSIELTENEKADLIAFLHALTDNAFLTDSRFSSPKE